MRRASLVAGLTVALLLLCLVAAGTGQVPVPPAEVLGSILHRVGLDIGPSPSATHGESALWVVRFPRVVLAVIVGAALGGAGALMQGVFGNPLAEPGVIGVSSGAAVGAASVIVTGIATVGGWTVAAGAFLGGLLATALVYAMARSGGRTEVVTLVLTGIAVNAVAGALIGLLMFFGDADAVRAIAFWQLGSLAQANWAAVTVTGPCAAVGLAITVAVARRIDLLSLGDQSARHLGVRVERLRLGMVAVTALLGAAAVAFTGVISFVGLVVPHLVRMVTGPGHRLLLPASMLGGAIVVVAGDLAARTLVDYQELPLGVLTAVVGGPCFFWLLRRTRTRAGGWG
ncbi:FecCD family ABC transporter permease [Micromonospora endophytica]|uniref:Heme ABC transporter permease n=1 Tax=Micromonospora endophytica TaxID=515350 RepID=A0A2W2BHG5_9ACTN|nr:iron ABC transporter permease [Micromonospora endophytica]PZF86941.1 heme ABC transporter permease [Micromonospora endophytica]RIW47888.1 iron ABC transporter permease [Micromonospora endophytica]BCJ62251.1 ABC transporter permease [Micromonospora endophytica]